MRLNQLFLISCLATAIFSGCSGVLYKPDKPEAKPDVYSLSKEATPKEAESLRNKQLQTNVEQLNNRIRELEEEISVLTDKLEAAETQLALERGSRPVTTEAIPSSQFKPKSVKKVTIHEDPSPTDPEAGFTNDEAVQIYRESKVLFDTGKYSNAILAFTDFLKNYPLHPISGSAQFYIAESYYKRREYRLARREFQQILASYPNHHRTPETLLRISQIEDALRREREAENYRRLLTSLFPKSPAAQMISHQKATPNPSDRKVNSVTPTKESNEVEQKEAPTAPLPEA